MEIAASIRSVFHSLLIFSVVFTYGIGGAAAFEIKHGHAHGEGHEHASAEVTEEDSAEESEHHHHGEDHSHKSEEPNDPDEDSNDEEEGSEDSPHPHPHSHAFSLDTHFSFPNHGFSNLGALAWNSSRFLPENENCPEGPFYELMKPPQVS
jgi:hypothetical protein